MKLELVLKEELLQSGCELAPEDATQRGDVRCAGLSAQAQPLVTPGKLRSTSRVTCRS